MSGGGSKSKSDSVSGSAQKWAQPFARQAVGDVQSVFNQNQPNLQRLTDTVTGGIVPDIMGRVGRSGQSAGQAQNYFSDVLGGKFMNGNPHMAQLLARLRGDVTNGVNSQFALAGRYGSDAHGSGLARELANAEGNILYQNYSDEMNRMGQAAAGATATGDQDIARALAAIGIGAELPYTGSSNLANSLGALFSGGEEHSKSKQSGPGLLGAIGAIGAGIASNPAAFSDRRMKTKIKLLHRDPDGLGWYEFAYKSAPQTMLKGVMADEVKELRPQAYVPNWNGSGFDAVNYAAL